MIKDVFDSARTLELAVGRLELQQDVSSLGRHFDNWLTHVTRDLMNGETSGEMAREK